MEIDRGARGRAQQSVKVGLMGTGTIDAFPQNDNDSLQLLQSYSDKVASLTTPDTQVVVLSRKNRSGLR